MTTKWIKCRESLPETICPVLIFTVSNKIYIAELDYKNDDLPSFYVTYLNFVCDCGKINEEEFLISEVSHWMPLPKPPEGEE